MAPARPGYGPDGRRLRPLRSRQANPRFTTGPSTSTQGTLDAVEAAARDAAYQEARARAQAEIRTRHEVLLNSANGPPGLSEEDEARRFARHRYRLGVRGVLRSADDSDPVHDHGIDNLAAACETYIYKNAMKRVGLNHKTYEGLIDRDFSNFKEWEEFWSMTTLDENEKKTGRDFFVDYANERMAGYEGQRNQVMPSTSSEDERTRGRNQLANALSRILQNFPDGSFARQLDPTVVAAAWEGKIVEFCHEFKKSYGYAITDRIVKMEHWGSRQWSYAVFDGLTGRQMLVAILREHLGFALPDEEVVGVDQDAEGSTDSEMERKLKVNQDQTQSEQDDIDDDLYDLAGGNDHNDASASAGPSGTQHHATHDHGDDWNENDIPNFDALLFGDQPPAEGSSPSQAQSNSTVHHANNDQNETFCDDGSEFYGQPYPAEGSNPSQAQPNPVGQGSHGAQQPEGAEQVMEAASNAGAEGSRGCQEHVSAEQQQPWAIDPQLLPNHEGSFEAHMPDLYSSAMDLSEDHEQGPVQGHQQQTFEGDHIPQPDFSQQPVFSQQAALSQPQNVVPDKQKYAEIPFSRPTMFEQGWQQIHSETFFGEGFPNPFLTQATQTPVPVQQQIPGEGHISQGRPDLQQQPSNGGDHNSHTHDQSFSGAAHMSQQAFFQQTTPEGAHIPKGGSVPQQQRSDVEAFRPHQTHSEDDVDMSYDTSVVEDVSTSILEEMEIDSDSSMPTKTGEGQAANSNTTQGVPVITEVPSNNTSKVATRVDRPAPEPVELPKTSIFDVQSVAAAPSLRPVTFNIDFGVSTADLAGLRSHSSAVQSNTAAPSPPSVPPTFDFDAIAVMRHALSSLSSEPPVTVEATRATPEPVTVDTTSPTTTQEPGETQSVDAPAPAEASEAASEPQGSGSTVDGVEAATGVRSEMERPLVQVSETARAEAVEVLCSPECEEEEQAAAVVKQSESKVPDGGDIQTPREAEKPDNIEPTSPQGVAPLPLATEPETRPYEASPVDSMLEMLWTRVSQIQSRVQLAQILDQSAGDAKPATTEAAPAAKDLKRKKKSKSKGKKAAKTSSQSGKKSARAEKKAPQAKEGKPSPSPAEKVQQNIAEPVTLRSETAALQSSWDQLASTTTVPSVLRNAATILRVQLVNIPHADDVFTNNRLRQIRHQYRALHNAAMAYHLLSPSLYNLARNTLRAEAWAIQAMERDVSALLQRAEREWEAGNEALSRSYLDLAREGQVEIESRRGAAKEELRKILVLVQQYKDAMTDVMVMDGQFTGQVSAAAEFFDGMITGLFEAFGVDQVALAKEHEIVDCEL